MIVNRIRKSVLIGSVIPKPETDTSFIVKAWGIRRGELALTYNIPNHKTPNKPHVKGITVSEFEKAFAELEGTGTFTRAWFNERLPDCAREGACNYTTIGGIFELLGEAVYLGRGVYKHCRWPTQPV